jgi:putative flippase GtrA
MRHLDWLMGGIAIAAGLAIVVSAIANAGWLMESRRSTWLVEKLGHVRARMVLVAVGLFIIALGGVILSGWRPPWVQ